MNKETGLEPQTRRSLVRGPVKNQKMPQIAAFFDE
jgi:hypothetical protein